MKRETVERLIAFAERIPGHQAVARRLARRFIGGEELGNTVKTFAALERHGFSVIADIVGESKCDSGEIQKVAALYEKLLNAISGKNPVDISIKLSQFGLMLPRSVERTSWKERFGGLCRVLDYAVARHIRVWFDAETLPLRRDAWNLTNFVLPSLPFLGIAFQAYGVEDFDSLRFYGSAITDAAHRIPSGSILGIRLCKGAYHEPHTSQDPTKVWEQYCRIAEELLRLVKTGYPVFPEFATHDLNLIEHVKMTARLMKIPPSTFRFAMLYGRQQSLASHLAAESYSVAIYVPFGREWYPYLVRRILEKPEYALLPFQREGAYHHCENWPHSCSRMPHHHHDSRGEDYKIRTKM